MVKGPYFRCDDGNSFSYLFWRRVFDPEFSVVKLFVGCNHIVNHGVAPGSIAGARKGKHAEERVASIKHSA